MTAQVKIDEVFVDASSHSKPQEAEAGSCTTSDTLTPPSTDQGSEDGDSDASSLRTKVDAYADRVCKPAVLGGLASLASFELLASSRARDTKLIKNFFCLATKVRLFQAADEVRSLSQASSATRLPSRAFKSIELYGSLSFNDESAGGPSQCSLHLITKQSDVDFVIELTHKDRADSIVRNLEANGWEREAEVRIHRFASTQLTLVKAFSVDGQVAPVRLDLTFIDCSIQFQRFKMRQEAFQTAFLDAKARLEARFDAAGILAFHAYVHLLKAFAIRTGPALSGFQAVCLGIFTLYLGAREPRRGSSIAMTLFEGFLHFCDVFFSDAAIINGDGSVTSTPPMNYRFFGLNLSAGCGLIQRINPAWRCEMYLVAIEDEAHTPILERVNIIHSLDPARVAFEARSILYNAFSGKRPAAAHVNAGAAGPLAESCISRSP